jgi:hypothetical protein
MIGECAAVAAEDAVLFQATRAALGILGYSEEEIGQAITDLHAGLLMSADEGELPAVLDALFGAAP